MHHNPLQLDNSTTKRTTRRIWYGHGSSRLVTETPRDLPPAEIIDEAIAAFERIDTAATSDAQPHRENWQLLNTSLTARLAAQLDSLERQRQQLEKLLLNSDNAPIARSN
jgi:hypothetical protein